MKPHSYSDNPHLVNVGKGKGGLARHSVLGAQALPNLTSANDLAVLANANNLTRLAALVDSNQLNLLVTGSTLQTAYHLGENLLLIEGQLAVEDGLGRLAARDQAALQVLNKGHGLLHLATLADLGIKLLVVDGDGQTVEVLVHQINVLLLPGREFLGVEDSQLLRLPRVEVRGLALGQALGELALGGQNAGGGAADIVLGSSELQLRLGNCGELGKVNGVGL